MPISATDLNKAYLAYFGRPADLTGKTYFATLEQADVIKAFDASAESKALYGNDTAAKVNAIYNNLFNRDAEPAGLVYWTTLINQGRVTPAGAAFSILNGALGTDATAVSNKLAASAAFVTAMDTTPELVGFSGMDAAASARNWLKAVGSDAASLTAAVAGAQAAVTAAVAVGGGGVPGATFTLTAAIDNIVGTAGNDTIIGGSGSAGGTSTLGSADVINGGAGTDTFKVTTEGAAAVAITPNLKAVEKLFVQALNTVAPTTANLVNATGVQEIWNERSTNALTVTNVQELAAVGVKGDIGANAYLVGFKDSLAAGVADSVTIALDSAVSTGNVGFGGVTAANEFETINISATGTNSLAALTNSAAGALVATKAVNVTGAGKVTVTGALSATVTTIDASANTGGVSFAVNAASGAQTLKGGSGSDTFKLGATLTTADVVTGGDGNDILGVTTGASLVTGLQVTGVETLDVGGADADANTYDVSKIAGITTLKVGSAANATATSDIIVNNLAKGAGVEINAAVGAAADGIAINVKDAGAGSPNDSIDVLVKANAAFNTTGYVTINDIETVNLTADRGTATAATTHTVATLNAAAATTVAVKASTAALTITDLNALSLVLFDSTASTTAVSLTTGADAFTGLAGVALKFGAAADTLVLTGATTAGGDFLITGGAGGDKITLTATNRDAVADAGEEVEHLIYTAAADSQVGKTATGATKYDVITNFDESTAAAAFDKIDLKAFNIAAGAQSAFVKAPGTAITDTGEVATADQLNFFVNAGAKNAVAVVAATDVDGNTGGAQGGVFVYVDVNGDGNFNAADDMTIALVGVTAANLTANSFTFA